MSAVDEQHSATPAPSLREQERAGGADLDVEALAHDRARLAVEQDCDLVARRVLELLHHQLTALGRRAPVHLPQGLSLLVLAHAV